MSAYMQRLAAAADEIIKSGKPVRVNGPWFRACLLASCPLVCAPCGIWSCFWRALACPIQCVVNGPWFMCADNSCTAFTDVCISSHVEEIDRVVEFVPFDAEKASKEDVETALKLAAKLMLEFADGGGAFGSMHYVLCETVVRPLTGTLLTVPATAHEVLVAFARGLSLNL
jgi:hypothetical protein